MKTVNWIAAYCRLFKLLNKHGPTYCSGRKFLYMAQRIDPTIQNYGELIAARRAKGQSNSRNSFCWDIIQSFQEQHRYQFFQLFIDALEQYAKDEISIIREIVFGTDILNQ